MRLKISKTKNAESFYMIKSTYINGVNSSYVVEKLGTLPEVIKRANGKDPYIWAKEYIAEQTLKEKEAKRDVQVSYSPAKPLKKDAQRLFNGGYLFLQKIYRELKLDRIAAEISGKHNFKYDLNSILANLLYTRILFPSSKLASCEYAKEFIEPGKFDLQHIYRALSVIAQESDFIQSQVYKNSLTIGKRNANIVFYDCTNFFFELEEPKDCKQYGKSKEHRPLPIVQMGLFMDTDGIPLSFSISPGNTNEQVTLKPLEQKLIENFGCSKLVVCTDAGLSSTENRKFNSTDTRAYITTQSLKKLKKPIRDWCLEKTGWQVLNSTRKAKLFDLSKIDEDSPRVKNLIFYKERWINEDGLEQKIIVSYSVKYKLYSQALRERQVKRAEAAIANGRSIITRPSQTSPQRFINTHNVTPDGEIAKKKILTLNEDKIANESMYDGFYAVCTNLEEDAAVIVNINKARWEIEECFRIMKSEFVARPVYLQRDERIKAHFMTCFLSLIIYRYIEKRLKGKYSVDDILKTLKGMNFLDVGNEGYLPTYKRTELTDALHEAFGFRTDTEIVTRNNMKKILQMSKKR